MSEVISGMVIGGKYTLSSGMVLEDATVEPGGVLSALAGGTAVDITCVEGWINVSKGGLLSTPTFPLRGGWA